MGRGQSGSLHSLLDLQVLVLLRVLLLHLQLAIVDQVLLLQVNIMVSLCNRKLARQQREQRVTGGAAAHLDADLVDLLMRLLHDEVHHLLDLPIVATRHFRDEERKARNEMTNKSRIWESENLGIWGFEHLGSSSVCAGRDGMVPFDEQKRRATDTIILVQQSNITTAMYGYGICQNQIISMDCAQRIRKEHHHPTPDSHLHPTPDRQTAAHCTTHYANR